MKYTTELAKKLKERTNVNPIGNIIGTVIATNPLQISIFNGVAILDNDNCKLCSKVTDLVFGDKLLICSDPNENLYFVIDKVVI